MTSSNTSKKFRKRQKMMIIKNGRVIDVYAVSVISHQ